MRATQRDLTKVLRGSSSILRQRCQRRAQSTSTAGAIPSQFNVDKERYKHNLGPNVKEGERSIFDDDQMVGMGGAAWEVGGRQIKLFFDDSSEERLAKAKQSLPGMLPCDQPGSQAEGQSNAAKIELQRADEFNKKKQQLLASMAAADRNTPITEHLPLPADLTPSEREQHDTMVKAMRGRGGMTGAGTAVMRGMMRGAGMMGAGAGGRGVGAAATRAAGVSPPRSPQQTGSARTNESSSQQRATAAPRTLAEEVKEQATDDRKQSSLDAAAFYATVPKSVDKDALWQRVQRNAEEERKYAAASRTAAETMGHSDPAAAAHQAGFSADSSVLSKDPSYVDYIKNEEDIKAKSYLHFYVGQWAFEKEEDRQDYYACHILCMALNKSRWNQMDVAAQRGVGTTGVGMRTLFWKESLHKIINSGEMISGQFVDAHPVLRPFASVVKRRKLTKAFMRGFVDARLRILPQPGNMEQLCQHFDKTHGYFFNMLLEVLGRKDDNLEHLMKHVGRAAGIMQAVMLWRKYAQLGHTLLPADICARHHVNVGLLMNTSLANKDICVRNLIHDASQVAFDEMRHACQLARDVDPVAWPVLIESVMPNYYLQFLQNYSNDVSRFFADTDLENYGFRWYLHKKVWHWNRHHDVAELLDSAAPVPFLGLSWGYGGVRFQEEAAVAAQKAAENDLVDGAVAQGGLGGRKMKPLSPQPSNTLKKESASLSGPCASGTCGHAHH